MQYHFESALNQAIQESNVKGEIIHVHVLVIAAKYCNYLLGYTDAAAATAD